MIDSIKHKKIIQTLVLALLFFSCNQQPESSEDLSSKASTKTIKVYLLGTFHFAQTDSTYNVLDEKHQKSIEELCQIIASREPNKVFLERQPEFQFQNKIDSLYTVFRSMKRPLKAKNEIYQVGFRVAKMLNHDSVYLCDHPGRYGYLNEAAYEYAQNNDQTDILERKRIGTVERYEDRANEDSIMKNSSLLEYIKWINSDKVMDASHASYISNWPLIGSTDFYNYDDDDTLIYTKMINQVDFENDNAIVLIMGADHIPIIKNLFDANPYFEVVSASKWLDR